MSHFATLVVLDDYTEEALRRALQPWHEFECTGVYDEYVVDVDRTEEARTKYENYTVLRIKGPDGALHDPFNEEGEWREAFSKPMENPDAWDRGRRELFVPPGFEKVDVPAPTVESFAEWAESYYGWKVAGQASAENLKYGWIELDAQGNVLRCIDRTNPNKKWDWWVVGGRYSGKFHVCQKAAARVGQRSWTNEAEVITGYDVSQWGDLDIDAMRAEQIGHRQKWIDEIIARSKQPRSVVYAELPKLPLLHARWMTLPEPRPRGQQYVEWLREVSGDLTAQVYTGIDWDAPDIADGQTTEDWINAAPPLSCWAIVKDGEWYEKGEMGWWGMSSGDKADHQQTLERIFESIRPDQWVVCVDCHI